MSQSFVYSLVDSSGKSFEECPVDKVYFPEEKQITVMKFRKAVWKENSVILTGILAPQLQVFKNKEAFEKRNLTEGREDPLDDDFVINNSLGQSKAEALIVAVPPPRGIKRPLSDEDILMQELIDIANQGNQILKTNFETQRLVLTPGDDFSFRDRNVSHLTLANLIDNRYDAFKKNMYTRMNHPISYLADGPGSGKSRFLQELPYSFRQYFTSQRKYSDELKSVIDSAVYINVSFGNGSTSIYDTSVSIKTALCLRILHQFCTDKKLASFSNFYSKYRHADISLNFIRNNLLPGIKCFVLGIDELNQITHPHNIEDLIRDIGSECCYCGGETFFVPILAGTNIRVIKDSFKGSTFVYTLIPLPLLSYQSCVDILIEKEPDCAEWLKDSFEFRQFVADVGGHARSLEFLYDSIKQCSKKRKTKRWSCIRLCLTMRICNHYEIINNLDKVIAHTFLSTQVTPRDKYDPESNETFLDLQELGIIKLDGNEFVQMPYIFISIYMQRKIDDVYPQLWFDVNQQCTKFWQNFEEFHTYYIPFRLASFAVLGKTKVRWTRFFYGAVTHLDKGLKYLKIPELKEDEGPIVLHKRFPKKRIDPQNYQMVLNADGAPFDAFMYVESNKNERILLLFQMKQSANHRPMKLTSKMIHTEYDKCDKSINRHLPGTKFILVIIARLHGNYDPKSLPENTIVICQENMHAFYRDALYRKIMAGKPI